MKITSTSQFNHRKQKLQSDVRACSEFIKSDLAIEDSPELFNIAVINLAKHPYDACHVLNSLIGEVNSLSQYQDIIKSKTIILIKDQILSQLSSKPELASGYKEALYTSVFNDELYYFCITNGILKKESCSHQEWDEILSLGVFPPAIKDTGYFIDTLLRNKFITKNDDCFEDLIITYLDYIPNSQSFFELLDQGIISNKQDTFVFCSVVSAVVNLIDKSPSYNFKGIYSLLKNNFFTIDNTAPDSFAAMLGSAVNDLKDKSFSDVLYFLAEIVPQGCYINIFEDSYKFQPYLNISSTSPFKDYID